MLSTLKSQELGRETLGYASLGAVSIFPAEADRRDMH